ncbi:MAG: hypothetical protein WKF44_06905 [Rubrobacteraceae bacterium]|nr:hypothetical protein [Rubrobacter sp.]
MLQIFQLVFAQFHPQQWSAFGRAGSGERLFLAAAPEVRQEQESPGGDEEGHCGGGKPGDRVPHP